jgi:catalase
VHNNQRDGFHRQAIHRGRVAYEPNSLAGGCPFQAGAAQGFVTFPARLRAQDEQVKVRGKPEKFADHYTQARLFFDSQAPVEQLHIENAFRFELSKVTVPAIRARVVSTLRNVNEALATRLAQDLGMAEVPPPMPLAIDKVAKPEVAASKALSLFARPGNGSLMGRKVAIVVAPGVEAASIERIQHALVSEGAVPRLMGPRIGPVEAADGTVLDADVSLENEPGFLFDALVLPDGAAAVDLLAANGRVLEHLKDVYRHCKAILVLGQSTALLTAANIEASLPGGGEDEALVIADGKSVADGIERFLGAMRKHRNFARETDPPRV